MNLTPKIFKNKVVLLTGGAQGIGRVTAKIFAQAGATVVIADIQKVRGQEVVQALKKTGQRAHFIECDLSKEMDIRQMIELVVRQYKRLDIVINCARPKLSLVPFRESLGEWDLAMDIFLKAPGLIAKYAIPIMKKNRGGVILNVSSTNAFFISHQPAAYHVAKAGIIQLTRYLAYEFGQDGIRVNAICPALVDLKEKGKNTLTADPVNRAVTEHVVPLKRAATAEEIADAALFLCSPKASYITGQILTIDGGVTLGDHFGIARNLFRKVTGSKKKNI